jgi:hypothetical protein
MRANACDFEISGHTSSEPTIWTVHRWGGGASLHIVYRIGQPSAIREAYTRPTVYGRRAQSSSVQPSNRTEIITCSTTTIPSPLTGFRGNRSSVRHAIAIGTAWGILDELKSARARRDC